MKRSGARAVAAALCLLASNEALANGRYPTAGLVAFDPNDRAHFALRTTFGMFTTNDRGKTFDYVCESALRLGVEEDPMMTFTATGPLVVATFGGVLASADGCSYDFSPELEGQIVRDLARSASAPDSLIGFRLLGRGDGFYDSNVIRSDDAGASWTFFPLLPQEFLPLTVDFGTRETSRVYLTARRGADEGYDSVLMVSDDGGETFSARSIPDTADQHLAYIAAVHPSDPERLAVRVDDLESTVLLETTDAGETFRNVFVGNARLTGFAYSPDGSEMAFGGLEDGLYGGAIDGDEFERLSDVGPTCLAWNDDGLYACADWQRAGFSFGRSTDGGRTFEALMTFPDLCGRSSCGTETDVAVLCASDWVDVAPSLGATCDIDAGTPSDAGTSPDADAGAASAAGPSGRGGCSVAGAGRSPSLAFAVGFLLAVEVLRRRSSPRPTVGGGSALRAARSRRARAFGRGFFRFRRGNPSKG